MNCPKCGNILKTKDSQCNICKLSTQSDKYYNEGLKHAKNNNITNAIESLLISIDYNNKNIKSLNLIGLCYDRVGRIGEASKYWIKSCIVEQENNIANEYLKKVEEKLSEREKINDSIKMYNQALVYFKQKSDDIALIQLKKATELNVEFVEAYNLMALCYLVQNKNDKAVIALKHVLKVDAGNKKALRYMQTLGIRHTKNKQGINNKVQPKKVNTQQLSYNTTKKKKDNVSIGLGFIAGVLCALLISFFLVVPSMQAGKVREYKALEADKNASDVKYTKEINDLNEELNQKNATIELLNEENQILYENKMVKEIQELIYLANTAYNERDYVASAQYIRSIDTNYLSVNDMDTYNELKANSYPKAGESLYKTGVSQVDKGLYEEGLNNLLLSIELVGVETNYYANTLYSIGRAYEGLGDTQEALKYYEDVVNNYNTSSVAYSAQSRINAINNQ